MATKNTVIEQVDPAVSELQYIKRLLVLLLLKGGSSQGEIAKALNIGQATVSRHYGMGDVKSFTFGHAVIAAGTNER